MTTAAGEVYGAAAANVSDARGMVAARLAADGESDWPMSVVSAGRWSAPYGTVLHY